MRGTHSQTKSGNGCGTDRPVRRPHRHEHRSRLGVPCEQRRCPGAQERLRGDEGAQGPFRDIRKDRGRGRYQRAREKRLADDGRLQRAPTADRHDRPRRPGRPDRSRRPAGPAWTDRRSGPEGREGEPGALLGAIRIPTESIVINEPRGRGRRVPTWARCVPAASGQSAPARAGPRPGPRTSSTPSSCVRSSTGAASSWATRRAAPTARAPRVFTLYVLCYRR